jgi:hypothetical protein
MSIMDKSYKRKGEERRRYAALGAKGKRAGDPVRVEKVAGRWTLAGSNGWEGIIVERYYTLNWVWRNYHARVEIKEGPFAGKLVSVNH